jgi:hypothetical protein
MAHAFASVHGPGERLREIVVSSLPSAELDPAAVELAGSVDLDVVEGVVRTIAGSRHRKLIKRVTAHASVEDPDWRYVLFELDRDTPFEQRLAAAAELDTLLQEDAAIDFELALRDTSFGV